MSLTQQAMAQTLPSPGTNEVYLSGTAFDFSLPLHAYDDVETLQTPTVGFEEEAFDPNKELRIGKGMGLKMKGTGNKVKVDAFVEQGAWEMRGKFLTGENPIDVDGLLVRFERPVDWWGWTVD